MIPALIGLSFDILYAWARGDVHALQRMSTPRMAQMFASGLGLAEDDVWRRAARAWVDREERMVKGRTDGQRGYVRFHTHADHAWVLVFDCGRMPLLDGTTAMLDRDFESFGAVV